MAQQPQQDNNNEIAIAIFLLIFIGGGSLSSLADIKKSSSLPSSSIKWNSLLAPSPHKPIWDLLYQLKHKEAYRWTMLETAKLGYVGQLLFPTLDFPVCLFGVVLRQEPLIHHSSLQQDNETD